MRTLRHVAVWLVALAVLFAGPVATLGECLRCPPDCPMHVRRDAPGPAAPDAHADHASRARHEQDGAHVSHTAHDAHAAHDAQHAHADAADREHARHAAAADDDCHRGTPPVDGEGPCLSGVCGHMDPSLARMLPDGVLVRASALAPALAPEVAPSTPAGRPAGVLPEPPTEPPRSRLA